MSDAHAARTAETPAAAEASAQGTAATEPRRTELHMTDAPVADAAHATPRKGGLLRFAPLAALVAAAGAAIYFFGDALSFDTLRDNREQLLAWRDANVALVAAAFVAIYAAVVALSIPGAIWMTLLGGFLFGTWLGAPLIVLAATLGATLVFLIARTGLGEPLRAKAGPWLAKLEAGFKENAWSYMLILRLVPAFPFFVVNLAPALLGARLSTFVWTTALGIVPGTLVFTSVGAGLGEVIDQGGEPNLGIIFEPHVLGPLLGLAALSALPVLVKALRRRAGAAPIDAETGPNHAD